jgi:hypothetical protein
VRDVPPGRLLHLVRQAYMYQIEFSRYTPPVPPRVRRHARACCC